MDKSLKDVIKESLAQATAEFVTQVIVMKGVLVALEKEKIANPTTDAARAKQADDQIVDIKNKLIVVKMQAAGYVGVYEDLHADKVTVEDLIK